MTQGSPYDVLGVPAAASAADIKAAYRKLARELHPDANPDDAKAAERFKAVSAAYALLSDPDKRARFDRGEIDAQGQEKAGFGFHPGGHRRRGAEQPFNFEEVFGEGNDPFASFFGGRTRGGARGANVAYALSVPFVDAVLGASRRVTLSDGKSVNVRIPPGTEDGKKLRLKGMGMPGLGNGAAGDAVVEITVEPHKHLTRDGKTIRLSLPVGLKEAVLGTKITVPTVDGAVAVTVPKGSNTGTVLRLRGKGVPDGKGARGDQLVTLQVVLPAKPDAKLEAFLKDWDPGPETARKKAGLEA